MYSSLNNTHNIKGHLMEIRIPKRVHDHSNNHAPLRSMLVDLDTFFPVAKSVGWCLTSDRSHCSSWITGLQTSESRGNKRINSIGYPITVHFSLHSIIRLKLFYVTVNKKCGGRIVLLVMEWIEHGGVSNQDYNHINVSNTTTFRKLVNL
ncbi:hypothetical protein QTP88_004921 [Uroleucon formosanum]